MTASRGNATTEDISFSMRPDFVDDLPNLLMAEAWPNDLHSCIACDRRKLGNVGSPASLPIEEAIRLPNEVDFPIGLSRNRLQCRNYCWRLRQVITIRDGFPFKDNDDIPDQPIGNGSVLAT